jgi:hypothetical protein
MLLLMQSVMASEATDILQQRYQKQGGTPFSAKSGELYWNKEVNGRSCTTCHTHSVKAEGQHKRTGKIILPIAPSVNPKRLTNRKKIEKWFLRNCKWTYGRECSAQEKGDILQWLKKQ